MKSFVSGSFVASYLCDMPEPVAAAKMNAVMNILCEQWQMVVVDDGQEFNSSIS